MQETVIKVQDIQEFQFGQGRTGWNVIAEGGGKYSCFSSTEMQNVMPGMEAKIKYKEVERNGYTNYQIIQVADDKGNFTEKQSSGGGGRTAKADPEKLKQDRELEIARNKSIQRQVAAKEATQIMISTGKIDYSVWDTAYTHILDKLLEVK